MYYIAYLQSTAEFQKPWYEHKRNSLKSLLPSLSPISPSSLTCIMSSWPLQIVMVPGDKAQRCPYLCLCYCCCSSLSYLHVRSENQHQSRARAHTHTHFTDECFQTKCNMPNEMSYFLLFKNPFTACEITLLVFFFVLFFYMLLIGLYLILLLATTL